MKMKKIFMGVTQDVGQYVHHHVIQKLATVAHVNRMHVNLTNKKIFCKSEFQSFLGCVKNLFTFQGNKGRL